nr:putative late blight resistance protein homolog R1B-17 [Ipomoea trifida]
MAFVAVSSLMRSLEFQFLHPQPRLTLSNKKQIESLHEKLGGLLVFLDKFEKNADNLPEMRAVIEEIIDVSVKAEDVIEEELLTASFSSTKLEESLQRVVDEVEKLLQITMKTTELVNNNLTVGGSSLHVDEYSSELFNSNVDVVHEEEDAMVMVGHSEELNNVINQLIDDTIGLSYQPWLSLKVVNPDFHISISSKQWRSILCFNGCGTEWYLQATSFKKLRVLDLSKIEFKSGMPPDITDLVFLRYLALASSSSMLLNQIPLDKNWNLQTLIISDKDAHKLLPHGILDNLQQLRHLEINHKLHVSIDLLKVQENLQTFYWLSISQCTAEVFMRIPNVKELGIVAGGHKVLPQGLGLHFLCFLNYLEKLRIQGSDHPLHLPPFNIFPKSLKELTFVSTRIPWKAMSIFSKLPNLEVLKLKNYACTGQEWEITKDGNFPQLKVLIISLTDLKYWKANLEYPFPNLECLKLKKCFRLEKMPDWIVDVFGLQLIKLVHCYASLVHSANERHYRWNDRIDVLDFHTRPVSSLMRSLEFQFLHPQPRLTLPNKKQIESLHEKLGGLLVFLDKFEKNADNLPEMRAVIEEIIDVSVKAEDRNEEDLLTASFSSTKLEESLQRVVDEVEKLLQITMNASSSSQHTSHEYTSDLFHSNVGGVHVKDAMVGHSEELNKVRSWLLNPSIIQLQVMAVVGMGGIGKTTFAKRIYDDPTVNCYFDKCAWTTMSQEHNKGQAILDLIRCVMPFRSASNDEMQRWLSLKVVNPDFHISISSKQWRSILCFNGCGTEWYLQATSFKKLRVLELSKIEFKSGMPPDITELVFLRYLALASSRLLKHIPLDKNWNLQTLIISEGDDKDAHKLLPHGIWDLPQLMHLEIYHQVSIDLLRVVQENLQTLYWLSTSQCRAEVFMRIPNVKELGVVAVGHDEVSPHGLNNLCCLDYLEKLRVEGSDEHPLHLPPQPQGDIFPQSLKELTFVSTRMPWKAMSIISMLPNLEVLKLKKFACTGQVWELTKDDAMTLQLIKFVHCYASLVRSADAIKEEQQCYGNEMLDVLDFHTREARIRNPSGHRETGVLLRDHVGAEIPPQGHSSTENPLLRRSKAESLLRSCRNVVALLWDHSSAVAPCGIIIVLRAGWKLAPQPCLLHSRQLGKYLLLKSIAGGSLARSGHSSHSLLMTFFTFLLILSFFLCLCSRAPSGPLSRIPPGLNDCSHVFED